MSAPRKPTRVFAGAAFFVVTVAIVLGVAACLFLPNVQPAGYAQCTTDDACAPGRECDNGLCAPPPWHDLQFQTRQLLIAQNPSSSTLPKGTAIPVTIGGTGPLSLAEVGGDGRYNDYVRASGTWVDVPVYRDLFEDHVVVWIPLQRDLPAGARTELAWVESQSGLGHPTVVEQPEVVFPVFDEFTRDAPDAGVVLDGGVVVDAGVGAPDAGILHGEGGDLGDNYKVFAGQGTQPLLREGILNVASGQKVIRTSKITGPVDVTFRLRVNGTNCGQTFFGLQAGTNAGYAAPSAGFFVGATLLTDAEIAPTSDDVPRGLSQPKAIDTRLHRYTVQVNGGIVRFFIDDVPFDAREDLRPPFEDKPLFVRFEVDGDCSIDVDAFWVTPLPQPLPVVTAEPLVQLQLYP
jgi:hypothetical protein